MEFSDESSPPRAEVESVRMVDEPWRVAWMIVDRSLLVEISVDDDEEVDVVDDDMIIFVLVFLGLGVWRTKADDDD